MDNNETISCTGWFIFTRRNTDFHDYGHAVSHAELFNE